MYVIETHVADENALKNCGLNNETLNSLHHTPVLVTLWVALFPVGFTSSRSVCHSGNDRSRSLHLQREARSVPIHPPCPEYDGEGNWKDEHVPDGTLREVLSILGKDRKLSGCKWNSMTSWRFVMTEIDSSSWSFQVSSRGLGRLNLKYLWAHYFTQELTNIIMILHDIKIIFYSENSDFLYVIADIISNTSKITWFPG